MPQTHSPIHLHRSSSSFVIPGPHGSENLRFALNSRANIFLAQERLWRKYGRKWGIAQVFTDRFHLLQVSDPKLAVHILSSRQYRLGRDFRIIEEVLGREGLFTNDRDSFAPHMHAIGPFFQKKKLLRFIPIIMEEINRTLESWHGFLERKKPIDLLDEMMQLTLRISAKALFGFDLKEKAAETVKENAQALNYIFHERITASFSQSRNDKNLDHPYSPLSPHVTLPVGFQKTHARISEVIFKRREERKNPNHCKKGDLLDLLLDIAAKEGVKNDDFLRDQILTFLIASSATTGLVLTWTFYLLSQNPNIRKTLDQELQEFFQKISEPEINPVFRKTILHAKTLPYTKAVLQESLRLYPTAATVTRQSMDDEFLCLETSGGKKNTVKILPGQEIHVFLYGVHRNPGIWGQTAEVFDPSRFLNVQEHNPYYLPFGAGARRCIGRNFALLDLPIILSLLARSFHLQCLSKNPVIPVAQINLRPKDPIWMQLNKIRDSI